MVREFAISVYLIFFKLLFALFNRKPVQEKTTFVASFGSNIKVTLDQLEQQHPELQIVVLRAPSCRVNFTGEGRIILDMQLKHLWQFIRSIYHLATSSHVFVDNYYGFLAACDFKPQVECIQLWHAAGAIKQFGLEDLSNRYRDKKALERFPAVYERFRTIVVGSDNMAEVFKDSFGLSEERFLRTGVPRTDFFFNHQKIKEAEERLSNYFPVIEDKKMLLYAPTYRDGALDATKLHMDMEKMYEQLKYEYVLFLRLHPAVEGEFANKYPGFIYNVSNYPRINDLLVGSDILITDYSSIPFEYSLLEKPMIFYAYDYEEYALKRGVWGDYAAQVPGPVVYDTKELIETIKSEHFLNDRIPSFAAEWNEYSTGDAAAKLIDKLFETEKEPQKLNIREHA